MENRQTNVVAYERVIVITTTYILYMYNITCVRIYTYNNNNTHCAHDVCIYISYML
jgi:hypothetical protein